jgi:hypothetical protein
VANYRWFDLFGDFESIDEGRVFNGREYDDPNIKPAATNEQSEPQGQSTPSPSPQAVKKVWVGQSICDQRLKDGTIKVEIEFEEFDLRCMADIVLQHDPNTKDMLTFSLGANVREAPDNFYTLRLFSTQQQLVTESNVTPTKRWTNFHQGGERQNLKAGCRYPIEVSVRGSNIRVMLNGVEILRHNIPFELPGLQISIFCAGPKKIFFRDFQVDLERPQAFVVMQFNTPEYESLFNEVIKPTCENEGLRIYRADFSKQPGIIISEITKQIKESRVVIAEVTPVVLIADKTVEQLPFDVRPYRNNILRK